MEMTKTTRTNGIEIVPELPAANTKITLGKHTGSSQKDKIIKKDLDPNLYKAKIQELTTELLRIEQAERERIASELHDHIGQDLLVIKLRLQVLRETLGKADTDGSVGELIEILDGVVQKTREMTTSLNLQVLSELGLKEAISAFIDKLQISSTIRFSCYFTDEPVTASAIAQALIYRCICELIINAVKHSEAANLSVTIDQTDEWVRAVVRDDGIGLAATGGLTDANRSKGCGLTGIQERVSGIGGDIEISSHPGVKTEAVIRIPRYID